MSESMKIVNKNSLELEYYELELDKIKRLTQKLGYSLIIVNRLDYYGNMGFIDAKYLAIKIHFYGGLSFFLGG